MIETRHVTKYYRSVRAVEDVSLEVAEHASVAVLGPSGSGKTTLLRLIAGLEVPDKGEITIDGKMASTVGWALAPSQRGIGFVFQTPALWPHMTVTQNIMFGLHGIPRTEAHSKLQELLVRMSLAELARRYPHQISGGEARRVALARALAPEPRYLLMDEPLTSLDPKLKGEMISLINESMRRTKASLLYVTHDLSEARKIAARIVSIRDGRLARDSVPLADNEAA